MSGTIWSIGNITTRSSMNRGSYYVILFRLHWKIPQIHQILLFEFILLIQSHTSRIQSHLWILKKDSSSLWDQISSYCRTKWKWWDHGSKYPCIYCYCTVHFSSYCFSTYHLRKNGWWKQLICIQIELLLMTGEIRMIRIISLE